MGCLRGVRAIAPSRRSYQNGYLYGALEVGGDGSEFLFTPAFNKEWDRGFISQISPQDPASMHVILGDGAGFHLRQAEEGLPLNVKIITLSAYSLELNPVEKLWNIVKDGICNRDWTDLDELEEEIIKRIKLYWEDTKRMTRLIGNGYLLSELDAILKIELRQYN